MIKIPFNKPFLTGKEAHYLYQAVYSGKLSGNGIFTQKCHQFFQERYGFGKCLLTTSCTDALEMCALLLNINDGDEIIIPSYTFVSTANPFVLRGAKIVFADSYTHHPNIDPQHIEALVTPKTKAIVVVHYAGVSCDMDAIMDIANRHQLFVVEDAAQAIDSFHEDKNGLVKPLGSIGHLAAFSFHETKNIIAGEGGMLVVNDSQFIDRAEIIWEKGTNRSAFFRGEVDKYGWVDIGSSFLPSEVIAAFLFAQIEHLDLIQTKRKEIWTTYYLGLKILEEKGMARLPTLPNFATNNAHMFYLLCNSLEERSNLIQFLKENGVWAVFHYLSLHDSPFYTSRHDGRKLECSDLFSNTLVRLPLFYELDLNSQNSIIQLVLKFYSFLYK